jgi:recombinational DNA repair ATPase RecF
MIIQSLELRNFRGFREIRIDFDHRLTVLVGTNGAGKTTILDALAILLDQYAARLIASRSLGEPDAATNSYLENIEDLVRLTGYDRLPATMLSETLPEQAGNDEVTFEEELQDRPAVDAATC